MIKKKSFCNYLFLEILSRLPVDSLCRFRCVSKQWQSLIQHPYVTTKDNAPFKLQVKDRHVLEYYSIQGDGNAAKLIHRYEYDDVLTSVSYCKDMVMYHCGQQLSVMNLATQELIHIPPSREHSYRFSNVAIGFDPLSQKYKLYRVDHNGTTDLMVFTLENNPSWKTIKSPHIKSISSNGKPRFNSNGFLYRCYYSKKVLLFSFATEECSFIDPPSELANYNDYHQSEIFEVDNFFCLVIRLVKLDRIVVIGMWRLKDDHSWVSMTKNVTLSLEDTEFTRGRGSTLVNCQFFGRNTKILTLVSKIGFAERYIFEYNILSGRWKRIKATGLPMLEGNYYSERLV